MGRPIGLEGGVRWGTIWATSVSISGSKKSFYVVIRMWWSVKAAGILSWRTAHLLVTTRYLGEAVIPQRYTNHLPCKTKNLASQRIGVFLCLWAYGGRGGGPRGQIQLSLTTRLLPGGGGPVQRMTGGLGDDQLSKLLENTSIFPWHMLVNTL